MLTAYSIKIKEHIAKDQSSRNLIWSLWTSHVSVSKYVRKLPYWFGLKHQFSDFPVSCVKYCSAIWSLKKQNEKNEFYHTSKIILVFLCLWQCNLHVIWVTYLHITVLLNVCLYWEKVIWDFCTLMFRYNGQLGSFKSVVWGASSLSYIFPILQEKLL